MRAALLSLAPALVTIVVAMVWRRVATALFCGVLAGALVAAHFHPLAALAGLGRVLLAAFTDVPRLEIVAFILLVGGLLEILSASGAYATLGRALAGTVNTGRRARMAAWGLSFCLFFDDYANVLLAGTSMRNTTDRNRVSAAVLAYLVDVVALMASVMLVSTWAAWEGALMVDAGRAVGHQASTASAFLASLPFHMYTYLAFFLSLLVAWSGRWFGTALDDHAYSPAEESQVDGTGARLRHVLAPVATLLGGAVAGIALTGTLALRRAGEPFSLIGMLGASPTVQVLIAATLAAIAVAALLLHRDRVLGHAHVRVSFHRGLKGMVSIGMVVLLATALSQISRDLGTGTVLAGVFQGFLSPATLPLIVFLLALLVTLSTGFSWGSMAVVMPVAYQMGAGQGAELLPLLSGAVITGAVSGEHIVPYSEKAVMTAAACGIPPVYHVRTQALQTLATVLAAAVGFLLLGLGWGLFWSYALPAAALLAAHLAWARPAGFHPGSQAL